MVRLERDPIDPAALLATFCQGRTDVGAVVSFTGLTRARTDDLDVTRLTLDACPGAAEQVMAEIEAEARAAFDLIDMMAVHRWGVLEIGQPIVFVAAAAMHRRAAFQAADFLMDQIKIRAPLWKKEDGPSGPRWIEAREQDHIDAARWIAPGETP